MRNLLASPTPATPPTAAAAYLARKNAKLRGAVRQPYIAYVSEFADFWNQAFGPVTVTRPNGQTQTQTIQPQNTGLTPAAKLTTLATEAVQYLLMGLASANLLASVDPTNLVVPALPPMPAGYQFVVYTATYAAAFANVPNFSVAAPTTQQPEGTAVLQKSTITTVNGVSTVTWANAI